MQEIEELQERIEKLLEDIETADDRGVSSYGLKKKLEQLRKTLEQLREKYEDES